MVVPKYVAEIPFKFIKDLYLTVLAHKIKPNIYPKHPYKMSCGSLNLSMVIGLTRDIIALAHQARPLASRVKTTSPFDGLKITTLGTSLIELVKVTRRGGLPQVGAKKRAEAPNLPAM